jgi:hypothetical protein
MEPLPSETEVEAPHECNYLIDHTHLLMLGLKVCQSPESIAEVKKAAHVPNKRCQFENETAIVEP